MRIVHTADWHVGRTIRGRSRATEHQAVLAEIARITDAEAFQLAVEQYKQMQPQGINGLGALLGGGQQEIPDGAIGGAIR